MSSESIDILLMSRALALAERGRGRTSPNPMVGAVVVDSEGVVVGRGFHEFAGGPHAEVRALKDAGERARDATLYCTLEPCCYTGRTGPCAPLVVASGIRRIVVASEDPNPRVNGRGLSHLRNHGVDVTSGVLEDRAECLNRAFFSVMRRRRPFVTMKVALSLDGAVSSGAGVRTALTGAAANRLIDRDRAETDAIAVGSGTMLSDDPTLTARGVFRRRPLIRVVFDSRLRTSPSARLLSTLDTGPVIIMCRPITVETAGRAQALVDAGARLEELQTDDRTPVPVRAALERLATMGVTSLIVEGGPTLHHAVWDAGVVDCVQMYVTRRIAGVHGLRWIPYPDAAIETLTDLSASVVGDDVRVEGYVHRPD
ncbi:MAG: bifunctional diaminohydroxyphosphoribosylaminopyrimidine deaminase/5-amino-6-(5-phosphoribosylamino)uracil reductase RibD [Acidobacteria bacterium]|nr:bifunctional diaminohydroxyphosphoribosylaminopyrimidine deaminase/5-amino-6-(5-phosphoribosylamino)uracil reductase RibD [Acidobacteriota bacterium]MCA1649481.1 bifunctional diaminohydroxyphosphoribosylaminopyrimidine deaminase/5-amino-6-(5-phosphoribosylamino)uracil reductase RibD [Acidobacteriota bacterium]